MRHRRPAPGVRGDRVLAAVAAAGFLIAAYLTVTSLTGTSALFCEGGGSGCDVVQSSRYAWFLAIPTAAWGAAFYLAVGGLALAGLTARRWLPAFVLGVAGVAVSAYLTYVSVAVVRAVCGYCLASAAIALALLALLVARRPHSVSNRAWGSPAKLAALGLGTAVLTLAIAAVGFRAETPQEATARQAALARHLSTTGAIFYGAYW